LEKEEATSGEDVEFAEDEEVFVAADEICQCWVAPVFRWWLGLGDLVDCISMSWVEDCWVRFWVSGGPRKFISIGLMFFSLIGN
jgi:hypothetical protein